MPATVTCAKLGQELPAIDPSTPEGDQAARMCLLFGGPALRDRVLAGVSAQAWGMWTDYMRMVMNEYRLDPTSDEANEVFRAHMEDFFFGQQRSIPNYVAPK